MSRTKQIANRFREVILDGRWIAYTNFKDQLEKLDWKQANTPIGNLNTIALLTFHINYYVGGVLQVLEGGPLDIRDKFSFDMPPISSQEDWEALQQSLWQNAEKFAQLVEQLPDDKLDDAFVDIKYGTYARNLEGMIEHCYYHLGQVVLLNKLLLHGQG